MCRWRIHRKEFPFPALPSRERPHAEQQDIREAVSCFDADWVASEGGIGGNLHEIGEPFPGGFFPGERRNGSRDVSDKARIGVEADSFENKLGGGATLAAGWAHLFQNGLRRRSDSRGDEQNQEEDCL